MSEKWEQALREMAHKIYKEGKRKKIEKIKRKVAGKYHLSKVPKNWKILESAPKQEQEKIEAVMGKQKPVRTISGVAPVAVMTAPLPCPGNCLYCPGGYDSEFSSPQSYTGNEPAARRAKQVNYDPYKQVQVRLNQYESLGHQPRKCEIIIMGGTFLATSEEYKEKFIRGIYCGLLGEKYPQKSLQELQKMLEHAKYRMTGLTIETRPDWCYEEEVDEMLRYGATRVEIGVQTLNEEILKKLKRGHGRREIKKAFRIAKDSSLKIVAHIMLNLPYSSPEKELTSFHHLFDHPSFRPDMLKIYPTTIVKGSKLYEMEQQGRYEPYSEEKVIETIARMLRDLPRYVRVQRVQRDIPLWMTEHYEYGNLREMVWQKMEERGWKRHDIRSREVGHKMRKENIQPKRGDIQFLRKEYTASKGKELFLSFEDTKRDILIGFLRLRKPSPLAHRDVIDENTMLIRELHVFGPLVPVHDKEQSAWQHKGYGKALLRRAEKISREEFDSDQILVIAGIGAREYYRKLGYERIGPYMGAPL